MRCFDYHFVQNLDAKNESNSILERKLYSFKSDKTSQVYHLIVDVCKFNTYVVKFYLKNHRYSKRKYNILSNLNEPRNVLYTCLCILIREIYNINPKASFGFIASNLINESKNNTKRFRFYEKFISTFVGNKTFNHYKYEEFSAYILIPRLALSENSNLCNEIFSMFKEHNFCEEY